MLSSQQLQEDVSGLLGTKGEGGNYDVVKLILFTVLLLHMIFHCPFHRSFVNFLIIKKHALCPYRKARYWRCAKRRQRRASNKESTENDCAWLRCYKRQLPPPLPYRKRARPKDIPLQPEGPALEDEIKMTSETKQVAANTSSSANAGVDSRLDIQPSKMYRTRSLSVRLIDMVRMQQWQAIFDRPIKRKDAKFRDADGLYSLHWAAAGGAPTPVLQSLIDAYPSAIRKTDNEGSLPLHFAAHYSAGLGTVELLLRSYPEAVRAQDKYGRTPTYHAAEKSAKLEVLKLLVNEDPGTVTTPCYVVSNKSTTRSFTTRFDKKDLSSMTRSQAILTPLYLVWNDVVFDHNARTRHTGKKWEKAVWMLQQAYQHHTSRKNDSVLLACISMDIFLPEQVISLIVKAYPDLLRVPDSIHGNLPLATAAIACNSTPKSLAYRRQVILETLLDAYTPAVAQRNQHGRSVLWEAGATGRISWKILERILKHAPDALDWQDRETHLPLALYTAASSVSAIDPLSHHSSCVLEQDHPVDSTIRDFLDPFHLLTDKQFDLLLKEHEKEHKPDVPVHETTADHHHLNVIYEFLKANPSQIIVRS